MAFDNQSRANRPRTEGQVFSVRILIPLLLISVLLNILLARNAQNLRANVRYLKEELSSSTELKLGELLPPIQAKDLNGNRATVCYSESSPVTVLYIFSPTCLWCTRNLQNIKTLVSHSNATYRVIGVSLSKDKLQEYIIHHDLTFPIYTELSAETISNYKMGGTPRTLVVSPKGELLKNWFGAYGGKLQQEVEEYFSIKLPGIAEVNDNEKKGSRGCETCDQDDSPKSDH